jgi:hypothetical protein
MTQDAVEQLAQLVRLTYQDRVVVDWVEVERKLGRQLPTDYKEFATRFGPGHFEDGYLWVAVPQGEGRRLNFFESLDVNIGVLRDVRSRGEAIPYPLYPENGGVIPWASTVDGDVFFWVTEYDDPNRWPVVLNEVRTTHWIELDGPMTRVLHSILTDRVCIGFLQQDLGAGPHSFCRADPRR